MADLPARRPKQTPSRIASAFKTVGASGPEIASTAFPFPVSTALVVLQKAGEGFLGGRLTDSESRRVDIAGAAAIESIQSRLLGGEAMREDWQDELRSAGRTSADEIFEAALGFAARQYEERKAQHFGFAYAEMCFDESFSAPEAHHALRVADSLSYQQLCVLALIPGADGPSPLTRRDDYSSEESLSDELLALLRDIAWLGREELVDLHFSEAGAWTPVHGFASVHPAFLAKRPEAVRWGEILRLDQLDRSEVARVRALLE